MASISALRLLWVMVTIACIKPASASSQMQLSSFACLRHQAVESGMLLGTTVPKCFAKLSAEASGARPWRLRAAVLKKSALLMLRSSCQKHHKLDCRNQLCRANALALQWCCKAPLPNSESKLPVPYGCTCGNSLAS